MKEIIARCGFICSQCPAYRENIRDATDRRRVSETWNKYYGLRIDPNEIRCDGCLKPDSEKPERVTKECPIRDCVQQKNLENCAHCGQYPCSLLEKQLSNVEKVVEKHRDSASTDEYRRFLQPYNVRQLLNKIAHSVVKQPVADTATPLSPIVKLTREMTVAFIRVKGHYSQIPTAFGRLYTWIADRGYRPVGPAMAVYYTTSGQVPDDDLQWELRSEVAGMVAETAPDENGLGIRRVGTIQTAAMPHKGPYETVNKTYETLTRWIRQNGYEIVGPFEESYFNDLANTPNDELLTEIRFPIKKTS